MDARSTKNCPDMSPQGSPDPTPFSLSAEARQFRSQRFSFQVYLP